MPLTEISFFCFDLSSEADTGDFDGAVADDGLVITDALGEVVVDALAVRLVDPVIEVGKGVVVVFFFFLAMSEEVPGIGWCHSKPLGNDTADSKERNDKSASKKKNTHSKEEKRANVKDKKEKEKKKFEKHK